MSFKPFVFSYTPPETIPSQVSEANSVSTNTIVGGTPAVTPATIASQTATQLLGLAATADYLQDIILSQYKNTGVVIDPNVDPETARALSGCYNDIPPVVTSEMLSNLWDAQNSLNSIAVASNNTSVQADPFAASNVAQIINTATDHLLDSNRTQDYQLLTAMALKTDSLMFQSTAVNLSVYVSVAPGPEVADLMQTVYSSYASIYGSLYTALTTANIINSDINNVVGLAAQTQADLARLVSSLTFLKGMILKDSGRTIAKTLLTGIEAQLCGQISKSLFNLDNLTQRAIGPLKGVTGLLGTIVSSVKGSASKVRGISSNLTTPSVSPCQRAILNTYPGVTLSPDNSSLSQGLALVGHYVDKAQTEANQKFVNINESMAKLMLGRSQSYADFLELQCSMSNIESLIGLTNQLISSKASGALPASGSINTASSQVQAVIANLNTNPSVVTTLSTPSAVSTVLKDGGLKV